MKKSIYYWNTFEQNRSFLVQKLLNNDIFISSTDTVLGLLSIVSQESFYQLATIKKRLEEKSYVVLIGTIAQIDYFVDPAHQQRIHEFVHSRWPAPLTLIVPARRELPSWLAGRGTIALRMPDHTGLRALATDTNGLFSTSANISGFPVPTHLREIDRTIIEQIEGLIIDKDRDTYPIVPSTIIDGTDSEYRIIRQGAYRFV